MSDSIVRSRIFSIAWSLSGNFRRFQSAYGTSAYSAWPPTQPPMSTYPYADPGRSGLTFSQTPVLPSLQLRQRPHAMLKGTDTRSPSLMNSTPGPVSITSPVISCPRIRPSGAVVRQRTADVRRIDSRTVLELEGREVDVVDLDLARPHVGHAPVVSHG